MVHLLVCSCDEKWKRTGKTCTPSTVGAIDGCKMWYRYNMIIVFYIKCVSPNDKILYASAQLKEDPLQNQEFHRSATGWLCSFYYYYVWAPMIPA